MFLYSIYDRKAAYLLPIFQAQSDAEAVRTFADLVVQSDTNVAKYPADFDLVKLAHFDFRTGRIDPIEPYELIINGLVQLQASQMERKRYQSLLATSETGEGS